MSRLPADCKRRQNVNGAAIVSQFELAQCDRVRVSDWVGNLGRHPVEYFQRNVKVPGPTVKPAKLKSLDRGEIAAGSDLIQSIRRLIILTRGKQAVALSKVSAGLQEELRRNLPKQRYRRKKKR